VWLVVCALPERFYPQRGRRASAASPGPLAASGILSPAMSTLDLHAVAFPTLDEGQRVASAVGEGSMVVQFVHEYLKEM